MNIPDCPPTRRSSDQWPRKRHKDRQRTRKIAARKKGNSNV